MDKKKLRIAQLVLPWIPLPPLGYAGTERIVYNLTEGLVKKGHQVTLFSVGESKTSAQLEFIFNKSLGLQSDVMKTLTSSFYPLMHVAYCFEKQKSFDIIHSHAQFLALPFAAVSSTPSVHTFHRVYQFIKQDETDLVLRYGKKLNFTSISNAQRIPEVNFIGTVYNGIDTAKYKPVANPRKNYLFWAGRVIEKKGPREAIQISKKLNAPLIMAGAITEPDYYETYIKKEVDDKLIKFIGETSEEKMIELFQNAVATLVPIKWNEPFGLIPTESMACGTPAVAYANGGVKETIINGKTGYLVEEKDGIEELTAKTKTILEMTQNQYEKISQTARDYVVKNFSLQKMVDDYEKIYYQILKTDGKN